MFTILLVVVVLMLLGAMPILATQPRMGLLPKRWPWSRVVGCGHLDAVRPALKVVGRLRLFVKKVEPGASVPSGTVTGDQDE